MNKRFSRPFVLVFALVIGAAAAADADPIWKSLIPFQRLEADPHKSYWLTEEAGPWMVLAATFVGDGAEDQAGQLVLELRQRYKLPAYLHKQSFDYTKPVPGIGCDRYGNPKMMRYAQATKFDEYAVLVGDYDTVESPRLEKTLQRIKTARPECLALQSGKHTSQRFAMLREFHRRLRAAANDEEQETGPMNKAFVTCNPLLPKEYFSPEGLDPLVVEMNRRAEYSLLTNPGKYTVRVATFGGKTTMNLDEISRLEHGGRMESKLEDAALKAHKLTVALRKKNIEAYEFHDLYGSIVTIGSFDWVGQPRGDGLKEINPAVHQIMEDYAAKRRPLPGQTVAGLQPRTLEGISFDVQPAPVEVPRVSVAASYASGRLQLR